MDNKPKPVLEVKILTASKKNLIYTLEDGFAKLDAKYKLDDYKVVSPLPQPVSPNTDGFTIVNPQSRILVIGNQIDQNKLVEFGIGKL